MKTIQVKYKDKLYDVFVDDEDFNTLKQHKWYLVMKGDKPTGVYRREGNSNVYMHRQLLNVRGKWIHTDHIDRNPLNNQKENLRTCTIAENNFNRLRERQTHDIPYKGVYMRDTRKNMSKPYCVKIGFEGHRITLDTNFENMEEAARMYDELATKLHGEFASLNFPK